MQWSDQQNDIFEWFRSGQGNLVVRARAGTGKTTTILEGVNHAPERKTLIAAFNRNIATELERRVSNPDVDVKTLHGIGLRFVKRRWKGVQVDTEGERARRLARQACADDDVPHSVVTLVAKLASKGKAMCPLAVNPGDLIDLAYAFDCEPDDECAQEGYTVGWVAERAIEAMRLATEKDGQIDFDDMLFVPVRNRWIRPWFDLVVIDEAQDMSAVQLTLAMGASRGRIAVVGDDRQAIYGFRGADSGSIDRLKRELRATELGLTVTYRCPRKVVELAAKIVPDYTAAPSAPDGIVSGLGFENMIERVTEDDFILSRANAPLVTTCLRLLQDGKRAKIQGRDIGAGLRKIIGKLVRGRARGSMPTFLERLADWKQREVARVLASKAASAEARAEQICDQAETLRALSEGLSSISELEARIDELFTDSGGARVVCSSVHRAKGLEADRVFVLNGTFFHGNKNPEENNLKYVAFTRSRRELWLVSGMPTKALEGY